MEPVDLFAQAFNESGIERAEASARAAATRPSSSASHISLTPVFTYQPVVQTSDIPAKRSSRSRSDDEHSAASQYASVSSRKYSVGQDLAQDLLNGESALFSDHDNLFGDDFMGSPGFEHAEGAAIIAALDEDSPDDVQRGRSHVEEAVHGVGMI